MLKVNYSRNLPHLHPPGAALFLTMRLADSLPQTLTQLLRAEFKGGRLSAEQQRVYFQQFEEHLENGGPGPDWLRKPAVRELALHGWLQQARAGCDELLAACIMPNHAHTVVRLPDKSLEPFFRVLQRYKSATAVLANRLLERQGAFWARETYDHVVREGQPLALLRAVRYTAYNPLKAGLCKHWTEWSGTYVAPNWAAML